MVRADPGYGTVRCAAAPGVGADFELRRRIDGGELVTIREHHEYREELWVSVGFGCWLPRERLEQVPDDWSPPARDRRSLNVEFDLFTHDDRFASVIELARHGSVELFDEDERSELVAVALDFRPTSELFLELAAIYRGDCGELDWAILELFEQIPTELALDPELRERLEGFLQPVKTRSPTGGSTASW